MGCERVVVLSSTWELDNYKDNHRRESDVIFPLSPLVRYHVTKYSWKVYVLRDFFNQESLLQAKKQSEHRIKQLVVQLNNYSNTQDKKVSIDIGTYFHLQLHIIIGQIHYNQFIIDSIATGLEPKSWLMYSAKEPTKHFMGIRPDPETIFQQIFVLSKYMKDAEIIYHTNLDRRPLGFSFKRLVVSTLPGTVVDWLLELRAKFKMHNIFSFNKRKLLMLGAMYDWSTMLNTEEFKKKYYVDYNFSSTFSSGKDYSEEVDKILGASIEWSEVGSLDISYLSKVIQSTFLHMKFSYKQVQKEVEKYDAILATVFIMPEHNFIADIANRLKKPVITWQHGEMNLYSEPLSDAIDVRYTTDYLCYGDGAAEKYRRYIGKTAIRRVYSVGSTKKQVDMLKPEYILYATGKWHMTAMHFIEALDSDSRLYTAQEKLLSFLEQVGAKQQVVFKTSNTTGLNETPFICDNVEFEHMIPFSKLLQHARMVILDAPATTCIESCSINVPLFVLSGRLPWNQKAEALLSKRAIVSDDPDDLVKKIQLFLENGEYGADVNNTEFFEQYGSCAPIDDVKDNIQHILDDLLCHDLNSIKSNMGRI